MATTSQLNPSVRGSSRQSRNAAISARAYQIRELIEEERFLKDQLADFWEPRFMEHKIDGTEVTGRSTATSSKMNHGTAEDDWFTGSHTSLY